MPARTTPRLFHVSAWPIAVKLSILLLVVSLLPMGVTAALDLQQAREAAVEAEHDNLKRLAESGASRIDQLLADTQGVVAQVATDVEVVAFLAGDREHTRASAQAMLENVVHAHEDVAFAYLLDISGTGVLSTDAADLGVDYSRRTYYRDALSGERSVSEIMVGASSHRPGVYFSQAVREPGGKQVGVAVVKLAGEVIARMVDAIPPPSGGAFLVDSYGVVVSASDPAMLYRSLGPVPRRDLDSLAFEQRFNAAGVDRIESLGLDGLATLVRGAAAPGSADYAIGDGPRQIVGFAPVASKRWALAVSEPEARMVAPLARVTRHAARNALVVGLGVTLLALLLARTVVRPLHKLTVAAHAVERGDFAAADVDVGTEDEIGALSESFRGMARGLEARERELEIFGRMVSPEVREELLGGKLALGGETRSAAVLFSDIRGFSTLSEKMDPKDVVSLLNEYLTAMTAATGVFGGYVNNFIGDAIVVVFGVPAPQPEVERRAVSAALAMREALAALNVRRAARREAPIETGIGIAAGEMVAGRIGSPERMLYTVIGDAVNVAARLETLTKDYPDKPILVTGLIARALAEDPSAPALEPLGPIRLKGRTEPVDVFAVAG